MEYKFQIKKKHNHDHFGIEDDILFKTYRTIRGLRYMGVCEVPNYEDNDNVSDEIIEKINSELAYLKY